jgi:hypothetical protein
MNNKSFEDLESSLKEILSSFYRTLYLWSSAYVYPLSFSFDVFRVCSSTTCVSFVCSQFTKERLTLLMRLVYYLSKKTFKLLASHI